ncbi:MarR family winged helix-turn-helix transcriptional regulator [Chloroflexota bacterium]
MEKTRKIDSYFEISEQFDKYYIAYGLIRQVSNLLCKYRNKELSRFKMTTVKAAVLAALKTFEGPPTIGELARSTYRGPNTVSLLIKRMEKDGLVKKEDDLMKHSQRRIIITDKGEQVYQRLIESREIHSKVIACLSDTELDKLVASLRVLRGKVSEELRMK